MKSLIKGALFVGALALTSFALPTTEANACVSIVTTTYGSAVRNDCGYRIMGNYRGSDGSWGGYGPIKSGGQEGISMRSGSRWGVSYCNYEEWTRGQCRPNSRNEISY